MVSIYFVCRISIEQRKQLNWSGVSSGICVTGSQLMDTAMKKGRMWKSVGSAELLLMSPLVATVL